MRALRPVNALQNQNAAVEAQLLSQLMSAQAPTRRMVVDQTGLGKPLAFSGTEEDFCVWAKKVEKYGSGVFPKLRGVVSLAVESQDVVSAAAVAVRVRELDDETSAEIDGQLSSAVSRRDRGMESWRKLHERCGPCTTGRARSLLREILSPPRAKLLVLTGAVERMEDLVGRHCGGRDAQGNPRSLADDIRVSSLEALLLEDLVKHVQFSSASSRRMLS